jgi:hypothetical protein
MERSSVASLPWGRLIKKSIKKPRLPWRASSNMRPIASRRPWSNEYIKVVDATSCIVVIVTDSSVMPLIICTTSVIDAATTSIDESRANVLIGTPERSRAAGSETVPRAALEVAARIKRGTENMKLRLGCDDGDELADALCDTDIVAEGDVDLDAAVERESEAVGAAEMLSCAKGDADALALPDAD